MLKILLDEHISPDVAEGVRRKVRELEIHSLAEWRGGILIGVDDHTCLQEASAHGLTLITYDRRTIPPILKAWAEEGRSHAGVILVDERTIPPSDIGGLIRALHRTWRLPFHWEWRDRTYFLQCV